MTKEEAREKLEREIEKLKALLSAAKCPNCDGSGCIPHQVSSKTYVTRDMAADAGMPGLEGSLYSDDEWEAEQCQWCYERDQILKESPGPDNMLTEKIRKLQRLRRKRD